MSSGSYTIAISNPPATGQDLVLQTAPAFIGAQNNSFSVSQTFGAGIVDNGNLTVAGTSTFTGKATFVAAPEFLAGITVDIGEADVGTLNVTGSSSLNGGVTVLGAVSLPAASVADSALSSNVTLLNAAQTISAVKTFSAAPVLSGASITANSIPAASIVSASLTNTQIAPGGVGQASVSNGYADLLSAQTIAGVKTFSSAPVMSGASVTAGTLPAASIVADSINDAQIATAGVGQTSVASGYVDLVNAQTIAGAKTFSSAVVVPALTCSSLSCSSVVDTGTVSCTTLTCSSIVDTGALSSTTIAASGLVTVNGGLTVPSGQNLSILGKQTITTTQISSLPVGGVLTLALAGNTNNVYGTSLSQTLTALTLTGAASNIEFVLFVSVGGAGININKALTSGGITIYNNLSGNQAAANGSRWLFRGIFLSATECYLTITNLT